MSDNLTFKGYAVDHANLDEFKVISFEPKRFESFDIDIKIEVCGVCSSDVHTLSGGWGDISVLPLVSGHEVVGKITRIGEKVTEFQVGDRVGFGAQTGACLECSSCKSDNEQYCAEQVDTYNAKYGNGDISHGGYATAIRVHERFVFAIPDGLSSIDAAPMNCAGLTVYSPLVRYGVEGKKVGIIGIGGLGHYAVQFAKALGAHVTAFSHQADKEDDCKKMGADEFVLTTEKDFAKPFALKFDFILSTVDDAAGLDLTNFFSMLKINGRLHQCGLPDKPIKEFPLKALSANGASFAVNHIGSKKEANAMFKLAAAKGIKTFAQVIPMKDVSKAVNAVATNDVRYRYVLQQDLE